MRVTGADGSTVRAATRIAPDGRLYPGLARIEREFRDAGFCLSLQQIELFDCCRAEWRSVDGTAAGGVVGASQPEAAVYALAQLRRSAMASSR